MRKGHLIGKENGCGCRSGRGSRYEPDAQRDAKMDAEMDAETDAEMDAKTDTETDAEKDAEADAETHIDDLDAFARASISLSYDAGGTLSALSLLFKFTFFCPFLEAASKNSANIDLSAEKFSHQKKRKT